LSQPSVGSVKSGAFCPTSAVTLNLLYYSTRTGILTLTLPSAEQFAACRAE
jgi:hypothetical protein